MRKKKNKDYSQQQYLGIACSQSMREGCAWGRGLEWIDDRHQNTKSKSYPLQSSFIKDNLFILLIRVREGLLRGMLDSDEAVYSSEKTHLTDEQKHLEVMKM